MAKSDFLSIFKFPQPRRNDGNNRVRKDTAEQAAQKAFKAARHDSGSAQLTPFHPQDPKPPRGPPKPRPDPQYSNQKASPARYDSYPSQTGKMKMDEREYQDFSPNQVVIRKPSTGKAKIWRQGEGDLVPRANNPPSPSFSYEPGPSYSGIPRVTGGSEMSEPRQDMEPRKLETHRIEEVGGDSSEVIGRLYHHLRRVKTEFPSSYFRKDIPVVFSPGHFETAMHDLFHAYGSVYQSAQHFKTSLESQREEQEFLQRSLGKDLADKSRDYNAEISRLRSDYDREKGVHEVKISVLREEHVSREKRYDDTIKHILQDHQSEKDKVADSFKHQIAGLQKEMELMKQRYEDELSKLTQQHREQVTILDSSAKEEMSRTRNDFDSQMAQLRGTLSVTKEHYRALLEDIANQHEEEKRAMTGGFNAEKNQMNQKFQTDTARLTSAMNSQKEAHGNQLSKLQSQHEKEKLEMIGDFNAQMTQISDGFRNELAVLSDTIDSQKEAHANHLSSLRIQHEEDKRKLTSSFSAEKNRMNLDSQKEEGRLSSAIKSQKDAYEARLNHLRNQHEDDKERMAADHESIRSTMARNFDTEKAMMEEAHQNTKDQFHTLINDTEDHHNDKISRMANQIEMLREVYENDKKQIHLQYSVEKAEQASKWSQERENLIDQAESLKVALVRRDHFKAISDRELALRFQDLASEVDEFSRVRWDNKWESTWPFPDKVLSKSENERRTKQHIVENTIWVILYEKIFCTPFRVLGNEGRSLEREWLEIYGQDQKSISAGALGPTPTEESEKWRYETVKKCLEAISKPLLEWEIYYSLKQGYESCLREAMEEVARELGRVAPVSGSEKQRMSELVRKAAKLWLEIGQQPYRVFLVMSESDQRPSRSGHASLDSEGRQGLVAVPELRRMGNAQGKKLEKDELVSGCKGVFSVFSLN